jgi:hypothetical protein
MNGPINDFFGFYSVFYTFIHMLVLLPYSEVHSFFH